MVRHDLARTKTQSHADKHTCTLQLRNSTHVTVAVATTITISKLSNTRNCFYYTFTSVAFTHTHTHIHTIHPHPQSFEVVDSDTGRRFHVSAEEDDMVGDDADVAVDGQQSDRRHQPHRPAVVVLSPHQHRNHPERRPASFESLRQFPVDSLESGEQLSPSHRRQPQQHQPPHQHQQQEQPDELYHHNWEAFASEGGADPFADEDADDDEAAVNSHLDVYETVAHDLSNDIAVNAVLAGQGAVGPLDADVELFDAGDFAQPAAAAGRFAGEHRAQRSSTSWRLLL